jgi:hypothetical protein
MLLNDSVCFYFTVLFVQEEKPPSPESVQIVIHNFRDWCCHLFKKKKPSLGKLATITLEVVPFHLYALFPALLPFFKCILDVMFCEGVQHLLRFCPSHLSFVSKGQPVSFIFSQRNRQK